MFSPQPRRHPEAPRSFQRGEGSRAGRHRAVAICRMLPRFLARLKNVRLRDDAIDTDVLNYCACNTRSQ